LWRDEGAVGRQLVVDYSTAGTYPYEVIGVVGDIRFGGPRSEPPPEIYFPHAQRSYLILNVVIKTSNDPRALIPLVRTAMAAVDPQKPAQGLYLLDDLVEATYARERQATVTLILFAGTAVFLAVLGVYGVLAQRVRERAREIAIRMAMGANSSRLVGWVARTGLMLIASGIVAGLFLAWFLGGAIQGLLFGVSSTDTLTALVVVGLLTIVGLLATLLPSWRATRIDPVEILRRG
jgi:ABC-type antimicrobial peptide transport system permease subunit